MAGLNQNIIISVNAPNATNALNNLKINLGSTANAARDVGVAFALANAAVTAATTASVRFVQALNNAIDNAAQFQLQIARITNAAQGQGLAFDEVRNKVLQVSAELGKPVADVASAQFQILASQVGKGSESFGVLRDAVNLSKVTFSSTEESARALTSTINAFGLSASNSGKVAAILAQLNQRTGISIDQLSRSFGRVGPIAEALGVSIEEVSAAIQTLGQRGLKGNEAIQALSIFLNKLATPTKETLLVLQSLGFENGQVAIASEGLLGVLQRLAQASGGNVREFEQLFGGLRGAKAAFALATDGGRLFQTNLDSVNNAQQQFTNSIRGLNETEGAQYLKALNAIKTAFIGLGDAINVALGKQNLFLKGVALFVEGFGEAAKLLSTGAPSATGSDKAVIEALAAERDRAAARSKANDEAVTKSIIGNFTKAQQTILKLYEPLTIKATEAGRAASEGLKIAGETARLAAVSILEDINEKISDTKRVISEARRAEESVSKFGVKEGTNIERSDIDARIKGTDDLFSKQRLIETELKRLRQEARQLVGQGDKESLERAQDLFKEQKRLLDDRRANEIAIRKELVATGRVATQTITDPITGQQKAVINNTDIYNKALSEQRKLLEENLGVQKQIADEAKKRAEQAKQDLIQLELQKKAVDILVSDISKFSSLDPTGNIKKAFETFNKDTSLFDPAATKAKSLAAFDQLKSDLIKALKDAGASQSTIDQFVKIANFAKQRQAVEEQIDTALLKKKIENEKILLTERINSLKKAAEAAKDLESKSLDERTAALKKIKDATTSLQTEFNPVGTTNKGLPSVEDAQRIRETLELIQKRRQDLITNPSVENAFKLQLAIRNLDVILEQAAQKGTNLKDVLVKTSSGTFTIGEALKLIKNGFKEFEESQAKVVSATQQQVEAQRQVLTLSKQLKTDLSDPIASAAENSTTLATNLNEITKEILAQVGGLEELNTVLDKIAKKASISIAVNGGEAPGGFKGGYVQGFADGGYALDPRDSIPAFLAPGEFVINQEQTKRFFPLLQAINSGRIQPAKGFAQGGAVTNVGDIHINVAAGTADDTVRDIGRKLRRELRRGTITFND